MGRMGAATDVTNTMTLASRARSLSSGQQSSVTAGADTPQSTEAVSVHVDVAPTAAAAVQVAVASLSVGRAAPVRRVSAATDVTNTAAPVYSGLVTAAFGTSPQAPASPSPMLFAALAQAVRRELEQNVGIKTAAVTPTPVNPIQSGNLLVNPGAEVGDPSLSGYASVTVPGWKVTGTPTVIQYGTLRRLPGLFGTEGVTLPAFLGFPSASSAPQEAVRSSSVVETWPPPHSPKPSISLPPKPKSTKEQCPTR